jgi:advillin
LQHPDVLKLKEKIVFKVRDGFPFLLQKYGEEELRSKLAESDWNPLWSAYKREQEVKDRFAYLKGTVVERTPVKVELSEFYPLEALVAGVVWPSNVDVTKREQYLADDDFVNVFGVSKAAFKALPCFKRIQLKKEKNLF